MRSENIKVKYPIEYRLTPSEIETGMGSIASTIKNIGMENLSNLDIRLNSLDPYGIFVYETPRSLEDLKRKERKVTVSRVLAKRTSRLYLSIDGNKNGEDFSWESGYVKIKVGKEAAELVGVFSLADPYPPVGRLIRFEAVLKGLDESENLRLEFWADDPAGEFKETDVLETKKILPGEETRYAAGLTPQREGLYTIHAYLYDKNRQIGHESTRVWIEED